MSDTEKVEHVAGMAVLAEPMTVVDARNKLPDVPVRHEDPIVRDWRELATRDDWGLRAAYDFTANELLARELERWAKQFEGVHGEQLRRRAAWLRSPKVPGADT